MCVCLLAGKLSADDLNALIAHAHRRIDQLNRELAEQRVREQIHIDTALEQQKLEDQKILEKAVNTAMLHVREEARLEQERKVRVLLATLYYSEYSPTWTLLCSVPASERGCLLLS